ncbi:MAG: thermonuclease family protein [Alphaproteobacteria bacterium]|nr:thermonuclease family protein [Alphaproteobacteria bacterium]
MEISPAAAFRLLLASMLSLSVYFTIDVELRRWALQGDASQVSLKDGDAVVIDQPLDGDELAVRRGDDAFTVRLLGVKAFDPSNEPGLGNPGQRAIDALARHAGREAVVRFDTHDIDGANRLLAVVEVDGADLGAELIRDGWALVYTKYPFPDLDAYLELEAEAEREHRGMWSSPRASERARLVRSTWKAEE